MQRSRAANRKLMALFEGENDDRLASSSIHQSIEIMELDHSQATATTQLRDNYNNAMDCDQLVARMACANLKQKQQQQEQISTKEKTMNPCDANLNNSSAFKYKYQNKYKSSSFIASLLAYNLFVLLLLVVIVIGGQQQARAATTNNNNSTLAQATIHIDNHRAIVQTTSSDQERPLAVSTIGNDLSQLPSHFEPASLFVVYNKSINFTHIQVDELTQSVYLGATNWLLQLSASSLRPEVALRTGPAGFGSETAAQVNHRDCAPADCMVQLSQIDIDSMHQQAMIGHHTQLSMWSSGERRQSLGAPNGPYGGQTLHTAQNKLNKQAANQQVASTTPISAATSAASATNNNNASNQQHNNNNNNYNKILAIDHEARQLIVCGSLSQGACRRHQLGQLANFSELIASPVASNDEHSTTVALVAGGGGANSGSGNLNQTNSNKRQSVLYVAATNSRLGPYREMVPSISGRHLDSQGGRAMQIIERSFTDSARIDISFELRDYYLVNYLNSFQHNDFVYFVTVQRKSPLRQLEEWGYITRLARLCLSDLSFQSYAEMTLECRSPTTGKNYNLLQDAHLASSASSLAGAINPTRERNGFIANNMNGQQVLVGAFAQSKDHTTKSSKQSAICVYPMDKIEQYFNENIELCYNGTVKSRNMNYIAGSVSECPRPGRHNQQQSANNYCNEPIKLNGSLVLATNPVITYSNELITSISSTLAPTSPYSATLSHGSSRGQQQSFSPRQHQVLIAGTSEGQLKRIVLLPGKSSMTGVEFDALNLVRETPSNSASGSSESQQQQESAILQDMQLLPANNPQLSLASNQNANNNNNNNKRTTHQYQFALVATQHKLLKIRVNSCKLQAKPSRPASNNHSSLNSTVDECLECGQLQDPFCGWCSQANACLSRDECLQTSAQANSPLHWAPFDQIKCADYQPVSSEFVPLESSNLMNGLEDNGQQAVDVNVRLNWPPSVSNKANQHQARIHQLGAQLAGAQFACHFDYLAHWPTALSGLEISSNQTLPRPAGATTKAAQARLNVHANTVSIGCPLPSLAQRPLEAMAELPLRVNNGELRVKLSVRLISNSQTSQPSDEQEGEDLLLETLGFGSMFGSQHNPSKQLDIVEPNRFPFQNQQRMPVIERELTFYSCQQHSTDCRSCLSAGLQGKHNGRRSSQSSRYYCAWCPLSNRCTFSASHADFGCAASAIASTTPTATIRGSQLTQSLDRDQASVMSLAIERLAQCPTASVNLLTQNGQQESELTSRERTQPSDGWRTSTTGASIKAAGQQQQPEILVPHNTRKAVQLVLRQPISVWQPREKRVLKLECLLELEGAKARFSARLVDNQQVLCQENLFTYQAEQATQRALLHVLLNDVQVIETSEVILYKCQLFGVNPPYLATSVEQHSRQWSSSSSAWRAHELLTNLVPKNAAINGVQKAGRQSDCSLCANIERKFRCAWCSNQCQFQDHCQELAASTCPPPRIDSIHPNSGPLEGGTLLTIEGSNLGSNEREIQDKISVGGEPCQLLMYSVSTRIVCKTGPSFIGPQAATVFVGNRAGVTSAFEKFHYKAVQLTDVNPKTGPMSGGTRLFLSGSNLNIGSRVLVYLDDIPCLVDSHEITRDQITCVTSPNLANHSMRMSKLTLMIDNSTHYLPYPFTYQPDPIITQIEPSESFLSGGRLILITGHHLASPQSTKLLLYHENKQNIINGSSCITQNDTLITCLTPAISRELAGNLLMLNANGGENDADQQPTTIDAKDANNVQQQTAITNALAYDLGVGLRLKMMFVMDNVKSVRNLDEYYHHLPHYMSYFEDPQLFRLPLQVIDYVDELIIAGENLQMRQLDQDMLITIGGNNICLIKTVIPNQVICEPPARIAPVYDDNGRLLEKPSLPIVGLIGSNLRFQIGHMQYSARQYKQIASDQLHGSADSGQSSHAFANMPRYASSSSTPTSTTSLNHVLDYSSPDSSSSQWLVWILLSAVGFVIAFAVTFFFAIARFRQSKADREYKRIQLQMGSLDMNGALPNGNHPNGLLYSNLQLPNGSSFFQHVNSQNQPLQNFRTRALDYVGGALSGVTSSSSSSSTGKSKPFYQFTSQHHSQPPLPSFPPSPLTDISSLIGSGVSPAHKHSQQRQQHQQHVVKLNSDGTIMSTTASSNNNSNNQHHYSLYGVSNITGAVTTSSASSSSPGQNMFMDGSQNPNSNNNNSHHPHQVNQNRHYNWTQEAPSTIVPYAVIEACNLTLEAKDAMKKFV